MTAFENFIMLQSGTTVIQMQWATVCKLMNRNAINCLLSSEAQQRALKLARGLSLPGPASRANTDPIITLPRSSETGSQAQSSGGPQISPCWTRVEGGGQKPARGAIKGSGAQIPLTATTARKPSEKVLCSKHEKVTLIYL